MNEEQLKRANDIVKEKEELTNHLSGLNIILFQEYQTKQVNETEKANLSLTRYNWNHISFKDEFKPLTASEYLAMYKGRVEKKLEELQTEFDNI